MRGVTRAAVVAGIVVAVALTLAPARDGGALTNGLARGAESVVEGVQWVAVGMKRAVAGLFDGGRSWGAAPAYAQGQNRDGGSRG